MYTVPGTPLTGTTGAFVDLEPAGGCVHYQWQIEGTFDGATAQLEVDDASGSGGVAVSGVDALTEEDSGLVTIPRNRQARLTATGGGGSQSLTIYLFPIY